jgi:hypothetical protein
MWNEIATFTIGFCLGFASASFLAIRDGLKQIERRVEAHNDKLRKSL